MKRLYNIKHYACFIISMSYAACVLAQEPNFPVPEGNSNQLFYLQRSPNANTVVYELNYKNGILDTEAPVHVYWIRYGERQQKTELTVLQRDFAYGIKSVEISEDNYELHFVAYKKIVLYLKKDPNQKYVVYATIHQKPAVLVKIYLKINGGSFWSPNIEYAEMTGIDPDKGINVSERFVIKP